MFLTALTFVTNYVTQVPVLGGVIAGVLDSVDNVVDTVGDVGQYVADVDPVQLVSDLLNAPAETLGTVVVDVAGVVADLADDLNPLVASTASTPVLGAVVETVTDAVDLVSGTVASVGTGLQGFNALDELINSTLSPV